MVAELNSQKPLTKLQLNRRKHDEMAVTQTRWQKVSEFRQNRTIAVPQLKASG